MDINESKKKCNMLNQRVQQIGMIAEHRMQERNWDESIKYLSQLISHITDLKAAEGELFMLMKSSTTSIEEGVVNNDITDDKN